MINGKYQWTVLLILAFYLLPIQAEIYRWVDESGNVVFSDSPRKGAEKLDIKKPQSYKPSRHKRITPTIKPKKKPFKYTSFKIVKPKNNESIINNAGIVTIGFKIVPPLKAGKGHKIVFSLDDGPDQETSSLRHTLSNLDRGTHVVKAQIKDAKNKSLGSTSGTFHVRRHSIKKLPLPKPKKAP